MIRWTFNWIKVLKLIAEIDESFRIVSYRPAVSELLGEEQKGVKWCASLGELVLGVAVHPHDTSS